MALPERTILEIRDRLAALSTNPADLPREPGSTEGYVVGPDGSGIAIADRSTQVADGSVTTAKIADRAVTNPKIADRAVTNAKIADNAIDTQTIINRSVTETKIHTNSIATNLIQDNAVTSGKLSAAVRQDIADAAASGGGGDANLATQPQYDAGNDATAATPEQVKGDVGEIEGRLGDVEHALHGYTTANITRTLLNGNPSATATYPLAGVTGLPADLAVNPVLLHIDSLFASLGQFQPPVPSYFRFAITGGTFAGGGTHRDIAYNHDDSGSTLTASIIATGNVVVTVTARNNSHAILSHDTVNLTGGAGTAVEAAGAGQSSLDDVAESVTQLTGIVTGNTAARVASLALTESGGVLTITATRGNGTTFGADVTLPADNVVNMGSFDPATNLATFTRSDGTTFTLNLSALSLGIDDGSITEVKLATALAAKINAALTANDLASQAQAVAGTNNTNPMTPLRTRQAIDANAPAVATQAAAEAGSGEGRMTAERTGQAITAQRPKATTSQITAGTDDNAYVTPVLAKLAAETFGGGGGGGGSTAETSADVAITSEASITRFPGHEAGSNGTQMHHILQSDVLNYASTAGRTVSGQARIYAFGLEPAVAATDDGVAVRGAPIAASDNSAITFRVATSGKKRIKMAAFVNRDQNLGTNNTVEAVYPIFTRPTLNADGTLASVEVLDTGSMTRGGVRSTDTGAGRSRSGMVVYGSWEMELEAGVDYTACVITNEFEDDRLVQGGGWLEIEEDVITGTASVDATPITNHDDLWTPNLLTTAQQANYPDIPEGSESPLQINLPEGKTIADYLEAEFNITDLASGEEMLTVPNPTPDFTVKFIDIGTTEGTGKDVTFARGTSESSGKVWTNTERTALFLRTLAATGPESRLRSVRCLSLQSIPTDTTEQQNAQNAASSGLPAHTVKITTTQFAAGQTFSIPAGPDTGLNNLVPLGTWNQSAPGETLVVNIQPGAGTNFASILYRATDGSYGGSVGTYPSPEQGAAQLLFEDAETRVVGGQRQWDLFLWNNTADAFASSDHYLTRTIIRFIKKNEDLTPLIDLRAASEAQENWIQNLNQPLDLETFDRLTFVMRGHLDEYEVRETLHLQVPEGKTALESLVVGETLDYEKVYAIFVDSNFVPHLLRNPPSNPTTATAYVRFAFYREAAGDPITYIQGVSDPYTTAARSPFMQIEGRRL